MKISKIFLPATTGTSLMTLFSHFVSEMENKNFSEPQLLAAFEKRILPDLPNESALLAGWLSHYGIGILFTLMYDFWLVKNNKQPAFKTGFLFGAASGVAGIAMWKILFHIHPAPPALPLRKFFTQLFVAHCIFGIAVAETSKSFTREV